MQELLYQYNPWWENDYAPEGIIERAQYTSILISEIETKRIVFLTGLRRVGKTTCMKVIIRELISRGISPARILYFSADDYLFCGKNISEILAVYAGIHKVRSDEKLYLFIDEVTYLPGCHQQLKNLYDRLPIKIFASSSSCSLLREKKSFLTGRTAVVEIQPLNFEEYKIFKNITVKKRDDTLNEAYFLDYIKEGGLPENVLHPSREYLVALTDDIIQKDITAFHGLKNHQTLRDYFLLLMERSGKQFSINKLANILGISPDTANRFLTYFEETFLIGLVPRWGKTNSKLLSPKKVYSCDLGIKHLFIGTRDLGSYFENYLYLLLRNRKTLYYLYVNGIEIDFITEDGMVIEAKYDSQMTAKQQELFESFDADKSILIDSVKKLHLLDGILTNQ